MFKQYWNNPDATAEAFDEGWFNTGDLGEVDDEGFVRITGRKKDLIVTAGGKNVSPGPMEEIIRQDPLISNALIVGDGKPFIGVLVTLDEDELARWKATHNIPEQKKLSELAQDASLRAEVQDRSTWPTRPFRTPRRSRNSASWTATSPSATTK